MSLGTSQLYWRHGVVVDFARSISPDAEDIDSALTEAEIEGVCRSLI